MGRRVPSSFIAPAGSYSVISQVVVVPLIGLPVISTITILAFLCASRNRKSVKTISPKSPNAHLSTSSRPGKDTEAGEDERDGVPDTVTAAATATAPELSPPPMMQTPLRPPPAATQIDRTYSVGVATHGPIGPALLPSRSKAASRRLLSSSLSLRIPEGLAKIRTGRRELTKALDFGAEETLWKKTIIMGERCRAPTDDEEEGAVHDDKGNKVRTYRPRTPRSMPVSRNNSFNDANAQKPTS